MKQLTVVLLTSVVGLFALSGCASHSCCARKESASMAPAPNTTPHFFKVDERLYRGGQPTLAGIRRLEKLGVKTVVSLRNQGDKSSRAERELAESLGMRWVSMPMRMYWRPSEEQTRAFLQLVSDPQRQPVFVHCQHGEDRTGVLVAVYRVVGQGWAPEDAYAEALELGMAGWNPFMRHVILHEAPSKYTDVESAPSVT